MTGIILKLLMMVFAETREKEFVDEISRNSKVRWNGEII